MKKVNEIVQSKDIEDFLKNKRSRIIKNAGSYAINLTGASTDLFQRDGRLNALLNAMK